MRRLYLELTWALKWLWEKLRKFVMLNGKLKPSNMTDQELIEFYERLQAHEDEARMIREKFAELFPVVIPPGPMPIDDKSGAGIDF